MRPGLVRSGRVTLSVTDGTFGYAGEYSYYWSSRQTDNVWGSSGLGGYYLGFDTTSVNPSVGPVTRYFAFSLRCLSTVLDI